MKKLLNRVMLLISVTALTISVFSYNPYESRSIAGKNDDIPRINGAELIAGKNDDIPRINGAELIAGKNDDIPRINGAVVGV